MLGTVLYPAFCLAGGCEPRQAVFPRTQGSLSQNKPRCATFFKTPRRYYENPLPGWVVGSSVGWAGWAELGGGRLIAGRDRAREPGGDGKLHRGSQQKEGTVGEVEVAIRSGSMVVGWD